MKCLEYKIDEKIVKKQDGTGVDHTKTNFDELEDIGIEYMTLAKEFQVMIDSKLQEGHLIEIVEKAGIEKIEEGEMNKITDKERNLKKRKEGQV